MSKNNFICANPILLENPLLLTQPHNWVEHIPFAFYIIQFLRPNVLVELGVHTGNSFNAFCQAVKGNNLPSKCYGVDLWLGDKHAGFYDNEIYNTISKQVNAHFRGFAELIRKDFNEAVHQFADQSIDLLHIDGLHSYEAVSNDFNTWLPKMSKKGVVLFHDTQVRERGFGVYKFWDEVTKNYPHFEFKFGNGLGVLATGKEIDPAMATFLKEANSDTSIAEAFHYAGSRIFFQEEVKRLTAQVEKFEQRKKSIYYFTHPWLFVTRGLRGKL